MVSAITITNPNNGISLYARPGNGCVTLFLGPMHPNNKIGHGVGLCVPTKSILELEKTPKVESFIDKAKARGFNKKQIELIFKNIK